MSELVRRNLLAGLKTREATAGDAAIAAVAKRHGFARPGEGLTPPEPAPDAPPLAPPAAQPAQAPAAAPTPDSPRRPVAKAAQLAAPSLEEADEEDPHIVLRRRRRLRNRSQQFNVRLREDTIEAIYAESNARDIPLAQVIEEMVDTFLAHRSAAPQE